MSLDGRPSLKALRAIHADRHATADDVAQNVARNIEGVQGGQRRRLIIVSNRGPVEYYTGAESTDAECSQSDAVKARQGAGGVVSGLLSALKGAPVTWIALAMSDADRAVAREHQHVGIPAPKCLKNLGDMTLRLVDTPERVYTRYYEGISNRVLWFTQHYLLKLTSANLFPQRTTTDWEQGYRAVNEAVAEAVIAELEERGDVTPVLFQDYHLYLAPAIVRERRPHAQLAHFNHIPWPEARYWELLPDMMTQAIFRGLAANDVIGFQTQRDAQNFLAGAVRFLPGARVYPDARGAAGVLLWQGRPVLVQTYPIAVTPSEIKASVAAHNTREAAQILRDARGDTDRQLIVRVDRIEPTKNIARGFEAYERMLKQHPETHGQVSFLALLVPSRQGMAEYRATERRVRAVIERINTKFGRPDWQPVIAYYGNDRARALACMRDYDVLMVNPLIDGMNLVVKEGALANTRDGVIVLSRTAGAYEQLHEQALGVAPTDTQAMADALHRALTMSAAERADRAQGMLDILREEDAAQWLQRQVSDVVSVAQRQSQLHASRQAQYPRHTASGELVVGYTDESAEAVGAAGMPAAHAPFDPAVSGGYVTPLLPRARGSYRPDSAPLWSAAALADDDAESDHAADAHTKRKALTAAH